MKKFPKNVKNDENMTIIFKKKKWIDSFKTIIFNLLMQP